MFGKLLSAIAVAVLVFASTEAAAAKIRCDVMTIQATNEHKGIDPKLSAHKTIFSQQPFSRFDTFALVDTRSYEMQLPGENALVLPKPFSGQLKLNSAHRGRFALTLSLNRPEHKPIVINGEATPGAPLFAAGFKTPRGVFIFGVSCKGLGVNL